MLMPSTNQFTEPFVREDVMPDSTRFNLISASVGAVTSSSLAQ
jgi:hypothetical protein